MGDPGPPNFLQAHNGASLQEVQIRGETRRPWPAPPPGAKLGAGGGGGGGRLAQASTPAWKWGSAGVSAPLSGSGLESWGWGEPGGNMDWRQRPQRQRVDPTGAWYQSPQKKSHKGPSSGCPGRSGSGSKSLKARQGVEDQTRVAPLLDPLRRLPNFSAPQLLLSPSELRLLFLPVGFCSWEAPKFAAKGASTLQRCAPLPQRAPQRAVPSLPLRPGWHKTNPTKELGGAALDRPPTNSPTE